MVNCNKHSAFQEERMRRGDDLRLQMALEESKKGGPSSGKLAKKKKEVSIHSHCDSKLRTVHRLRVCVCARLRTQHH